MKNLKPKVDDKVGTEYIKTINFIGKDGEKDVFKNGGHRRQTRTTTLYSVIRRIGISRWNFQ